MDALDINKVLKFGWLSNISNCYGYTPYAVVVAAGIAAYWLYQSRVDHINGWRLPYQLAEPYVTDHSRVPKALHHYTAMPFVDPREGHAAQLELHPKGYLHQLIGRFHQKYGTIFRFSLDGKTQLVFIADRSAVDNIHKCSGKTPIHVVPSAWISYMKETGSKRGLFFMDDEEWVKYRKILNSLLLKTTVMKHNMKNLHEITTELMNNLASEENGRPIYSHLMNYLYKWALSANSALLLGDSLSKFTNEKELHVFVSAIQNIFATTAEVESLPPALSMQNNHIAWIKFRECCKIALEISGKITRKAILACRAKNGIEEPGCVLDSLIFQYKLSDDMAVRIIADLFLAAADTTSMTAQWIMFALAKSPVYSFKANTEIENLFKQLNISKIEHIVLEDLRKLPFCTSLLKETIRMYPVAPFVARRLAEDCVISGYCVPRETMTVMSVYSICRDPFYHEDPNFFKPERWTTDSDECPQDVQSSNSKQTSLPWGIPSRNCVGRTVAETMLSTFIIHFVRKFYISCRNADDIHFKMQMIGVPSEDPEFKLKLRED